MSVSGMPVSKLDITDFPCVELYMLCACTCMCVAGVHGVMYMYVCHLHR